MIRNQERALLAAAIVLAAVVTGGCRRAPAEQPPRRPNILFILLDDLRADTLGYAGHPYVKTPQIDRIANEGVNFKNAFCTTSLCSPSRASLLSGVYAHKHGVTNNFTEFPAAMNSFPKVLQHAGYATAYIGKYHMGEDNDEPRPGFDYFVTHKGQGKYFDTEFNINGERREVRHGYYTTVVTDMALDWLQRDHGGKPWLMILGHKAPHSFYTPEPKYAHAFDDVDGVVSGDRLRARRQAGVDQGAPAHVARHLRPALRVAQEVPRRPSRSGQGLREHGARLLGHDPQRRRQRRPPARLARGERPARQHDHRLRRRQRAARRRARHGRQADDARAEHPDSDGGALSGLTKEPRVIEQQVLTVDMAPSLLELAGAPAIAERRRPIVGAARARAAIRSGATSWFYYYNYEKEFPYTPNVRGVRTDEWKYIHYPHGDGIRRPAPGGAVRSQKGSGGARQPRSDEWTTAPRVQRLQTELNELMAATGLTPQTDKMPLDEGIKKELPAQNIR